MTVWHQCHLQGLRVDLDMIQITVVCELESIQFHATLFLLRFLSYIDFRTQPFLAGDSLQLNFIQNFAAASAGCSHCLQISPVQPCHISRGVQFEYSKASIGNQAVLKANQEDLENQF